MILVRKFILVLTLFAVLTAGLVQWNTSGYRLTPSAALRSTSFIPKDAKIIDHYNYHWCVVYVMKTGSGYVTAVVEKTGLFWFGRGIWNSSKSQAPIQTIGCVNFSDGSHHIAFLEVESNDPLVASIVAGPATNRVRKRIVVGKPVTFAWNHSNGSNGDYHPVALSKTGTKMYYYGYPTDTNHVNFSTDFKWYKFA